MRTAESTKQLFNKKQRSVHDVREERDAGHGWLNAHGDPAVEIFWDMNKYTKRDQIFKLRIPIKHNGERFYKEIWLDAEEMQKFIRWV